MQKLRVKDTVQVITGKDKGKTGEIIRLIKGKDGKIERVVVKGVNIVKKAERPNPQFGIPGGIKEFEKPIHVSNVMIVGKGGPTRVGIVKNKDGKKERISKKDNKVIN
ncbi:MAG: 50S ribosomal protein L24 [Candidatus Dojkabacteria bacterium]